MSENNPKPVSLLAPESTGGDIATTGFGFQDAVLMAKLPRFLAEDGFTAVIREAVCDFEASFFSVEGGVRREGFEAKDYLITPATFWAEIDTFAGVDATDDTAYGGFTLVSTGLSDKVEPVVNGLRRARDPYPFYPPSSGILHASFAEFEKRVVSHGKPESMARLLFDKVRIEPNWSLAHDEGKALFASAMHEHHPWSLSCSGRDLQECYWKLRALVLARKNRPVQRHEIESAIESALPRGAIPTTPVRLHTASAPEDRAPPGAIVARWERFSGEGTRSFPPPEEWRSSIILPLQAFRAWVDGEKRPRRVRLSGKRRLSTLLAIGFSLPAVEGFAIEMEVGNVVWATDAHPDGDTPVYQLDSRLTAGSGERLVVTLGIIREVVEDVTLYAARAGAGGCPRLDLRGTSAIVTDKQLNLVVRSVKDEISKALQQTSASAVDLFIAGPAPLALFLGHRMNAVAPVRCFEWVRKGEYTPTCELGGS
ncbi:MAG: SAVED domain-containing protein [Gemmataceae bacterium]